MERQYKGLRSAEFVTDAMEGYRLIWQECLRSLKCLGRTFRAGAVERSNEGAGERDGKEVGISYGFRLYARICAAFGLYIAYFITDTKPGLYPSMKFALFNYCALTVSCLFSIYVAYFVGWRVSSLLFEDFVEKFQFATVFLVMCVAYISHGLFSAAWFIRQRVFMHSFISESFIRTPRLFQRKQLIRTFILTVLLSCVTEPLYLASSFMTYITQENGFFTSHNKRLFIVVKYAMTVTFLIGAFMVGIFATFIPIFTSFLLSNITKYIKSLLSKQLSRIDYRNTTDVHNPYLLSLLHDYEREVITDFSCFSITMDWPSLDEKEAAVSSPLTIRPVDSNQGSASTSICSPATSGKNAIAVSDSTNPPASRRVSERRSNHQFMSKAQQDQLNVRVAFGADALLFAYRNLIKNLNQLKDLIRAYERRFGYVHLAQIYISGLITAQWVVFGVLKIRLSDKWLSNTTELAWGDFNTTFVHRAVLSLMTFVTSNTILFVRADRLPQQLAKMRSQLFRFNIELTRCASQQNRERIQSLIEPTGWPELEQVWLLYDQAVRMSLKARFRLGSDQIYDKNCLIQIFFGEVSAILLVIQVVDLYKLS